MSQFQYITKIELHDQPATENHPFLKTVVEEGSETATVQNTLFPVDSHYIFGIANLLIAPTPPIQLPLAIFFSLDKSHSMSLPGGGAENQPKMFYLKETMKNLLRVFANKTECEIWVAIDVFNNAVIHVQEFARVTPERVDEMIQRVLQYLEPDGSTNISDALKNATEQISQYRSANPSHKMVHIQLSDGEATVGESDKLSLAELVSAEYPNIFIGFGEKHDASMLLCLSGKKYGEYRFIDKVENTGLVCGEIAHHLLYCAVREAEIRIENGEIYDWKMNEWTKTLLIGELAGDTERTFHVRTHSPADIVGEFWGIPAMPRDIEEALQELEAVLIDTIFPSAMRPVLLDTVRPLPFDLQKCRNGNAVEMENAYIDLTRYMFRQRTQELLYETQMYNNKENPYGNDTVAEIVDEAVQHMKPLKLKLRQQFDLLKNYMRDCQETLSAEDKTFLKVLQDDIYIAHQTVGRANAEMYCRSRQQSQGNQTSYAVNNISEESADRPRRPSLRGAAAAPAPAHSLPSLARTASITLPDDDEDNYHGGSGLDTTATVLYGFGCMGGVFDDDTRTTFSGHTLSQNTDTTYSTPSVVRMMRDVSSTS